MPIDVTKVMVGAPDQGTTGAIMDAPVGTELPTDATTKPGSGFSSSGYVSEDGVTISQDRSTEDIPDWSGATIRKVLKSFDGTVKWSEIQMSKEALVHAFGEANVTVTAATAGHGEQIAVAIGADLPDPRSWVFSMKDGKARMRIVVPKGQVTEMADLVFKSDSAIALPLTLTTYPDENGKNIYIYTDDGQTVAA